MSVKTEVDESSITAAGNTVYVYEAPVRAWHEEEGPLDAALDEELAGAIWSGQSGPHGASDHADGANQAPASRCQQEGRQSRLETVQRHQPFVWLSRWLSGCKRVRIKVVTQAAGLISTNWCRG